MQITISNLTFGYNGQQPIKFPDFQVESEEHLLILGASGGGKSTLLHILAGLQPPNTGHVKLSDQDLYEFNTAQRDRYVTQHISMVWQKSYFVAALSMHENLVLAQKLAKKKMNFDRIQELSASLGLTQLLNKKPAELSVGEQQRFSIIRAALTNPAVLLADEPTSALDDENALLVANLLKETAAANSSTLLVVTHDARIKPLFNRTLHL